MSKHAIANVLLALALCASAGARAEESADLFARYKAASGGAHWDSVKSQRMTGTLIAGGLSGAFEALQDLSTGRSQDHYQLGPVEGADGYDGVVGWTRDPGGEVSALDAPEAKRRARSQAWLDARGYWYPARLGAHYGKIEAREIDHRRFELIEATPEGGDPLTLWFDAQTGLLARTVQRQGQDTATTVFDDWRDVDGLRLPFHSVTDLTDAAGRTDPRQRSELRLQRIASNVALADADFAIPAMAATARIDDPSGITRIPFDLVNNHIYVDGVIDGKKARFLVDTGGLNLLTPAAASRFGITGEGKLAARGVGDQAVDLAFAHAKEVRVGAATLANPVFYVIDLGDLRKAEGVAADGLVGYEMFRRFGVTIDYAAHVLTLSDPKKFAPPVGASAIAFELDDRIPIVNGVLDGVPVSLTVDTGSRSSLTLHSPFVRAHELITKYRAAPETVIGWGVGGPSRGRPARFGALKLGDLEINGIAGALFNGDKGSFANPDHGGNLGGGVLSRFTVAFDYAAKRMYLAPNARFGTPDAFDRSGLWMLDDGDALKVVDVAKGSAAERASLRVGDRIVSFDDEVVAKHPLAEWRQRVRELPPGTRIAVACLRDGKPRRVELVLADRIPAASDLAVVTN